MKGVTTIPNIVDIIIRATDHSAAAFNGARAQGASLSDTFAKVGKVSGAALVAIGALSVDMAAKFQSASTRLVTSAGESTKNIEMVKQGMLDMSTQVAFSR